MAWDMTENMYFPLMTVVADGNFNGGSYTRCDRTVQSSKFILTHCDFTNLTTVDLGLGS